MGIWIKITSVVVMVLVAGIVLRLITLSFTDSPEAEMNGHANNWLKEVAALILICATSTTLGFILRPNKVTIAKVSTSLPSRQSDDKIIDLSERIDAPLEFSNLYVKDTKIVPGQRFSAQSVKENGQIENWLENIKFDLKNKSDKQIAYILFELQFPDTEVNGPLMVYRDWGIGLPSKQMASNPTSDSQPLGLRPGKRITAALSAHNLQRIRHFIGLRNFELNDMNRVVIKVFYVIFEDGMKWSMGSYYRPNPSMPGGYEIINQ